MDVKIKELGISFIRTSLVPPVVGFALTWLTDHHVTAIHASWVWTIVTVAFSAVWYVVFRGIEIATQNHTVQKWAGILLGYARDQVIPPVFTKPVLGDDEVFVVKKNDLGQANIWTIVALIVIGLIILAVFRGINTR